MYYALNHHVKSPSASGPYSSAGTARMALGYGPEERLPSDLSIIRWRRDTRDTDDTSRPVAIGRCTVYPARRDW